MRLRLPGNDRDTILQYRLGPDLADIALRLEEVVQDDPHHAAYQIVGMADLIETQAARIAELVEALESIVDYEMAACKGISESGVFPDGAMKDFASAGATLRKIRNAIESGVGDG